MARNDVPLYNPHDGLTGRDGGPYLDEVERRNAEIVRAAKEKRDPDFDNAPATAGTPLVTGPVLANIANPSSNPSMEAQVPDFGVKAAETLSKDKNSLLNVAATRKKTDFETEQEKAEAAGPSANPASPTVISVDEKNDE